MTANKDKTHCPSGHGYTPANTYIRPYRNGTIRTCRTCLRERMQKRRSKGQKRVRPLDSECATPSESAPRVATKLLGDSAAAIRVGSEPGVWGP